MPERAISSGIFLSTVALGTTALGALISILFSMYVHFDGRADALKLQLQRQCLRDVVMDEQLCAAIHRHELRALGLRDTKCPLRLHYPDLFLCPEPSALPDAILGE